MKPLHFNHLVPVAVGVVSDNPGLALVGGLLFIPLILVILFLAVVDKFTIRFVTLKGMQYMAAIKKGTTLILRNVLDYFFLAISNCFIGCAFGIISIIAIGIILAMLIIPGAGLIAIGGEANPFVYAILAILAVPVFILFMVVMLGVKAYITTYSNFTWSMFFDFGTKNDSLKLNDPVPTLTEENATGETAGNPPIGGSNG